MSVCANVVVELHAFALGFSLSVDIDNIVDYLQRISRFSDTSLDIVLTPIHRSGNNVSEHILTGMYDLFAVVMAEGVVIGVLHLCADGISRREIEHHDIALLRFIPTLQALIRPLRVFNITLAAT